MQNTEMHRLPVTKIQKFCTGDGPGIRTTVFLKGCPLRCVWCHNPETQSPQQEFFYTGKFCVSCGSCCTVCPTGALTCIPEEEQSKRQRERSAIV